jgi:hypothetical protein
MAIPFLNNINLSDNELQNAKLHITGTAPTAAAGQIYFDSSQNVAKYHDGSGWIYLTQVEVSSGTFVNASTTGTNSKKDYVVDLSATGTPDNTVYLRGDNTWAPINAIPGTYTFNVTADGGTPQTIDSGDVLDIAGGTYITTSVGSSTDTVEINHDATTRSDSTSTPAQLAFGDTFDTVTSVTTNATGHVTAINVATYELPDVPSFPTITLDGEVTGSGTTNIITTVKDGVLDVANFNASAIVTVAEGIENNDNDTTLPTSAAVKDYVDSAVVGGLVYQGGYNANTNIPDLTTSPNSIQKGWTYTVTADGTFFGEQLRSGDVLIAEIDSPLALVDWTRVQNNIDLASASQIGIGNVVAATSDLLDGLSVTYSSGTATVGLDIESLTQTTSIFDTDFIPIKQGTAIVKNRKATVSQIAEAVSSVNSTSVFIGDGALTSIQITSGDHGLGTDSSSFMIQLVDDATGETVYADVTRGASGLITIDFATAPALDQIKVLIQKIG